MFLGLHGFPLTVTYTEPPDRRTSVIYLGKALDTCPTTSLFFTIFTARIQKANQNLRTNLKANLTEDVEIDISDDEIDVSDDEIDISDDEIDISDDEIDISVAEIDISDDEIDTDG